MQNNEFDILENLEFNDETEKTLEINNFDWDNLIIFDEQYNNSAINEPELEQNFDIEINSEKKFLEILPEINPIEEKYNDQEKQEVKIKKNSNILSWIGFLIKYILTSTLIFWILLLTTNYSAYINIARSYIFKNDLKAESNWIINSVEASNIKEKFRENIEKNNQKDVVDENEKSSEYSLKKLINISNKNNLNIGIEITPYENRIVIPKIWQNIPLIDIENKKIDWYNELNDIFMKELEKWVIRYPWSAKPWNDWTIFIFGHSSNFPWVRWDYNDVFSLLDKVEYEDEIILYYGQKKYKYKIREKKVITPGDVSVLKRDKDKSELTLMTCWPIWTTLNRLIVTWELID
jgi:LPXTG-site transpeptidase (sortase) family protein